MYDSSDIPDIHARCNCSRRDGTQFVHSEWCAATLPPPAPPAVGVRPPACQCGVSRGDYTAHAEWCPSYTLVHPRTPSYDPPADWLMAWASGWMAGYATGHEHGTQDGEQHAAADLAAALDPMRRAAAHGIDVAIARGAWEQHQRRMGGGTA